MILDLSNEETLALLNVLIDIIEADRYPISPRIQLLQTVQGKCGKVGGMPPELAARVRVRRMHYDAIECRSAQ
jgi:hypothetical protein